MRQWVLLILLCPWTGTLAVLETLAGVYHPSELIKAALHVLECKVYSRYKELAIMQLSDSDWTNQSYQKQEDLTYLIQEVGTHMSLRLVREAIFENAGDHVLFLVDSFQAFRRLKYYLIKSLYGRELNFLILLNWRTWNENETQLEAMKDIFRTCLDLEVFNALIFVPEHNNSVGIYGYNPTTENCTHSLNPIMVNRYMNSHMQHHEELFHRVIDNLFCCPLKVTWYPYPPFVTFEGDIHNAEHRQETWRLSGVDGELLKLLATIFRFRIELMPPCEQTANFSCLNELVNNGSDVAIGAFSSTNPERSRFTSTISYHQNALVFVIRVDHQMGSVNQLIQPFRGTVWLALIISCMLALLLQWAWSYKDFEMVAGVLHVHTTLLGNPLCTVALPRLTLARCYVCAWMLLALVQRAAYQGKLFDVFRLPYEPPVPQRISELLDGDYQLLQYSYANYFPHNRTLIRPSKYWIRFQEMESASTGTPLITTALLDHLIYYNHMHWKSSRLTYVKENIYLYQLVMYMRHYSILKFSFDHRLKQLQAAGIVSNINRFYGAPMYYSTYKRMSHEVSPINVQMFSGVFSICSLMLAGSFVVFLLEMLSLHFKWLDVTLANLQ